MKKRRNTRITNMACQVPLEEYPFDAYPVYVSGVATLLSGRTVAGLHSQMPFAKLFFQGDIWLGSFLPFMPTKCQHKFIVQA